MSYTKEREEFIARVTQEGLPIYVIRDLLAKANTLQRIAELSCSSEATDRDRVPCPATKSGKESDCCCDPIVDRTNGQCLLLGHRDVPRIDRQEARIRKTLTAKIAQYKYFGLYFEGDPRGYVLRLSIPSRVEPIGVPSRGLPASYWERH